MDHVYIDEVLIYQEIMRKRKGVDRLLQVTIARSAMANNEEAKELYDSIKEDAGILSSEYLEAKMDKTGLEALKQTLSVNPHKKVE